MPLIEFHLSYSDMELDPGDFLEFDEKIQFVVHAPELFKDSHLMDLASNNVAYRQQSIAETQRVINITRDLKSFSCHGTTINCSKHWWVFNGQAF